MGLNQAIGGTQHILYISRS